MNSLRIFRVFLALAAAVSLAVFFYMGRQGGWPVLDYTSKEFYVLIGVLLAILSFVYERFENLSEKRIGIQLKFFDRWQSLRTEIEKLGPESDENRAKILIRRYIELLSLEFLMHRHINPGIWGQWKEYRSVDLMDPVVYGGKKMAQWYDELRMTIANKKFRAFMDGCAAHERDAL